MLIVAPIPFADRTFWVSENVRPFALVTLVRPTLIAGQLITSVNASVVLDLLEILTIVTVAVLYPEINVRRTLNAAKSTLVAQTVVVSAVAFPSVRPSVVERELFAWLTITRLNAPARLLGFTLAIHRDRKAVARSNVWPTLIVLEPSRATATLTPVNPSAFKTVAARMPSVWQRITWPCVLARLVWYLTLDRKLNAFQLTFASLNLVTHLQFGKPTI